jgi:hypothetical protein
MGCTSLFALLWLGFSHGRLQSADQQPCRACRLGYGNATTAVELGQCTTRSARRRPPVHFSCSAYLAHRGWGWSSPACSSCSPSGARAFRSRASLARIAMARVDLDCAQLATATMEPVHAHLALRPHSVKTRRGLLHQTCRGFLHRSGDLRATGVLYTGKLHMPTSLYSPEQQ